MREAVVLQGVFALIGCPLATVAHAEATVEPATGEIFIMTTSPEASQTSRTVSSLSSGFAVGPNAEFHGWRRHPDSAAPPQTQADFESGTFLLVTEDGAERGVLVNDWSFAWNATFRCGTTGTPESWRIILESPGITAVGGFLVIRRQDVNVRFDESCNLFVAVNGAIFRQEAGSPGLQAQIVAVAPFDRCERGLLGRPWSLMLFHEGVPVAIPEMQMTAHPEIRSAGGQIRIEANPLSIVPELPDELMLPHGSTPGFDDPGAPGGRSSITVTALDAACRAGRAPVDVPLPEVDFDVSLANAPQSGGHTHAPPSQPSPPPPTSPFFRTSLGAVHTLLNDIDPEAVAPPTANPGFDAFTGHLLGRAAEEGSLAFPVEAGEVAGIVEVRATALPSIPILMPGSVIAPGDPLALIVEIPGLVPLAVNPGCTT